MTTQVRPLLHGHFGYGFAAASFLLIASASCSTRPAEPEEVFTRRTQADSLMEQGQGYTDGLALEQAYASYNEALNIYASLDKREGMVKAFLAMGRNRRLAGIEDLVEELYGHALSLAKSIDNPRLLRDVLNHRADLAIRGGHPVAAMELLRDDAASRVEAGRERAAQLRLNGTARHAMGDDGEAIALLKEAASIAEEANESVEAAQSYYKLASMASLAARFDEAEAWALKALEADKRVEYGPGIAADLRALSIITLKAGKTFIAEDYSRRAWLAWRGLGLDEEAEAARRALAEIIDRPVNLP